MNFHFYADDEIRVVPEGCLECGGDLVLAGAYAYWCVRCWDVHFCKPRLPT